MKPTTEELADAYERAGRDEKKLVRDLIRKNKGQEARVVCEILEAFPGAHIVKRGTLEPATPPPAA